MKETRHRATFMYPGFFFPEEGKSTRIPEATLDAVLAAAPSDDHWFAAEVSSAEWTRYRSDEGEEIWRPTKTLGKFCIYFGDAFTPAQVAGLDGDHSILLANMQSNGWERVVRTRAGNWQPVESGDIVVPTPASAT